MSRRIPELLGRSGGGMAFRDTARTWHRTRPCAAAERAAGPVRSGRGEVEAGTRTAPAIPRLTTGRRAPPGRGRALPLHL